MIGLTEIDTRPAEADIIISSTASPLPIIGRGMVERALKARRNQPMLLVDIAVPRDVEPEVGKLANAYLYSVDDLQAIIENNMAQRKAAAVQAETIVAQESSEFMAGCARRAPSKPSATTAIRPARYALSWRPKRWPHCSRARMRRRCCTIWPIS